MNLEKIQRLKAYLEIFFSGGVFLTTYINAIENSGNMSYYLLAIAVLASLGLMNIAKKNLQNCT